MRRKGADAFVLAMATGSTVVAAASKAGIAERTAFQRMADEDWQDAIAKRQAEIVEQAKQEIASHLAAATKTLADLLSHESGTVQLGAARALLDFGIRTGADADDAGVWPTTIVVNRNYVTAKGEE